MTNARIWIIFTIFVILKLAIAFFVPIAEDEAYYQTWSHFLDWGYLDHPPMVAWLGLGGTVAHHWFFVRLLPVIFSITGFAVFLSLYRKTFRQTKAIQFDTAAMLFAFSFFGLLFGPLLTPDVAQTFFWIFCLNEASAALQGQEKRWISAGVAAGLGLISKYTMILIAPVFIIGIWHGRRAQFKSIWPYAGMATAFLVFAPHIYWNAQNDWATVRFQLKRGFTNSHNVAGVTRQQLPIPVPFDASSPEAKLSDYFTDPEFISKPRIERTRFEKIYIQVKDFIGSQLLMWGCSIVCLLWLALHPFIVRRSLICQQNAVNRYSGPMLKAAIYVPLIFFGAISFVTKVEANWPAVYVIGASILWSRHMAPYRRSLTVASAVNILLIIILLIHAQIPFLSIKPAKDRLLKETSGYQKLAEYVSEQASSIVLFDAYQLGSMLRFYAPQLQVQQWAGITRVSEFVRRKDLAPYDGDSLARLPAFDLLTYQQMPFRMPGFAVKTIKELRNCRGTDLLVVESPNVLPYVPSCPGETVRRWFLTHYEKE